LSNKSSLRQAEREFRAWGFLFFPTEYAVNHDRTRTRYVNSEDDTSDELADRLAEGERGGEETGFEPEDASLAKARRPRAVDDAASEGNASFEGQEFEDTEDVQESGEERGSHGRRSHHRASREETRVFSAKATRQEMAGTAQRKRGRPRKGDRQVIPWQEIDRLLVFGEMVRDPETGRENLRYPSQRELGKRFGVSGALIGHYSKHHQCMKRRKENQHREQVMFEQKLAEKLAEARVLSTAEVIEIVDDYMRAFGEALEEGRVCVDNASDFNIMMRLKAFLEGKVDSRQEVQGTITLEDMQARHRALQAQLVSLDPAITGEVQAGDRNRARGLAAEWPDGDELTTRAVTARRRTHGDRESAPRRVMAHEREDAFMDDVFAEECEDAPRGAVRALGRRAREGMDIDHVAGLEEARTPRHVGASRPAPTTTRRPGRERGLEFPDAVYPQRPRRGWDDQPEQGHRGAKPLRRSPKC
jgi:hypothetical protein